MMTQGRINGPQRLQVDFPEKFFPGNAGILPENAGGTPAFPAKTYLDIYISDISITQTRPASKKHTGMVMSQNSESVYGTRCLRGLTWLVMLVLPGVLMLHGCYGEEDSVQVVEDLCIPNNGTIMDYVVTFESTWSPATHPRNFPKEASFSGLIGASHNHSIKFWEEGQLSTFGISEFAETGNKGFMIHEVNTAVLRGQAYAYLSGEGMEHSPGKVSIRIKLNQEFPLVTLIANVVPSPDWFVGVSGLSLCFNDQWLEKTEVELYAYDAGTDSGSDYTAKDQVTDPPTPIVKIKKTPFLVDKKIPPLGVFSFERRDVVNLKTNL
ncbi:spondin domain-containing protein [Deltaproteobacteria bacterium TL4]